MSKYGHGMRQYASGVEAFYRVRGMRPSEAAASGVVCPTFPGDREGCAACGQCDRAGAKRGRVGAFSPSSRRRFKRLLMSVAWGKVLGAGRRRVGWLTLTFAGDAPGSTAEGKRLLRVWRERLRRRFPHVRVCWRLEYQARGVAHFHMLLVWPGDGPSGFLSWAVASWSEVTGAPSQAVHYRWVTSWRRLLSYLSDTGKRSQANVPCTVNQETGEITEDSPGRWWGRWGDWSRLLAGVVVVWGRSAWARGRRLMTRLVASLRKQRQRSRWRVGSAFCLDPPRLLSACGPGGGPTMEVGLDSVNLGAGLVRVWETVRWFAQRKGV